MAKCKYTEDFPLLAEGWAREGLTDVLIAKKLGIGKNTFYVYIDKFKDFSDALKRGKAPVDTEVENLLLKRARGYSYEEVKEEISDLGGKKTTRTIKHVIPDTTAQIFWLKNRKREQWGDQQEEKATDVNITFGGMTPKDFIDSKK